MSFDEIKRNLASGDPEVRARAMQGLLVLVRRDAGVQQEALAIFMGAIEHEDAPWAVVSAARGVAYIAGEQEGRRTWRRLLNHQRAEIAGAVVSVADVGLAPAVLEVLERRQEKPVQIPAVRALGRLRYAPAFDALVRSLGDRALRPHAVEALGDLGDPRAVAHLRPLLADKSEAWREDTHGPMLRVRDLAKAVIERLQSIPQPSSPARVKTATTKTGPGPSRLQPKAVRMNLWTYAPLLAGLATPAWFGLATFVVLYFTGSLKTIVADAPMLDLIVIAPPAAGLVAGIVALAKGGPRNKTEGLGLLVGVVLCGVFAFTLGWPLFLSPER